MLLFLKLRHREWEASHPSHERSAPKLGLLHLHLRNHLLPIIARAFHQSCTTTHLTRSSSNRTSGSHHNNVVPFLRYLLLTLFWWEPLCSNSDGTPNSSGLLQLPREASFSRFDAGLRYRCSNFYGFSFKEKISRHWVPAFVEVPRAICGLTMGHVVKWGAPLCLFSRLWGRYHIRACQSLLCVY